MDLLNHHPPYGMTMSSSVANINSIDNSLHVQCSMFDARPFELVIWMLKISWNKSTKCNFVSEMKWKYHLNWNIRTFVHSLQTHGEPNSYNISFSPCLSHSVRTLN